MIESGHWQLNLDHCFVLLLGLRQLEKEISPRSAHLPSMVFHPGSQCSITPVAVADPPDVYKGCHGLGGWQGTQREPTFLGEFDRLWTFLGEQVADFDIECFGLIHGGMDDDGDRTKAVASHHGRNSGSDSANEMLDRVHACQHVA